jgi:hypothetical protein
MKKLRMVLLAIMFAFATSAFASDAHDDCCDSMDCPIIHCAAMGCLAQLGQAVIDTSTLILPAVKTSHIAVPVQRVLPATIKEVWTPPD